jgi:hypothetical protein
MARGHVAVATRADPRPPEAVDAVRHTSPGTRNEVAVTEGVRRASRLIELTAAEPRLLEYLLVDPPRVSTASSCWTASGTTGSPSVWDHGFTQRERADDLHRLPAPEGGYGRAAPDPHGAWGVGGVLRVPPS